MTSPLLLDTWQIVLYIAIIVVAALSVIALLAVALLLLQLLSLVRRVRRETTTLLAQAHHTLTTVQGTSEFVAAGLLKPAIRVESLASGVTHTLTALAHLVVHAGRRRIRTE